MSRRAPLWDRRRMPSASTVTTKRTREALVFGGAMAVAIVHALDDAFVHRQPGVALGQHLLAAALAVGLGLGAVAAFPALRPALRAALAFLLGSLAVVNGAMHVKHVAGLGHGRERPHRPARRRRGPRAGGPRRRDPVAPSRRGRRRHAPALGAPRRSPCRSACSPPSTSSCRWASRITETHKFREPIGAPPGPGYRDVAFDAGDGVHLSGWYRPTRNGATILVLHGGGGDRTGAVAHARLLVRHGYGVLLYDARGRGRSEGVQNAWGWGWPKDVAGAIAFLKARPEVDPRASAGSASPPAPTCSCRSPGSGRTSRPWWPTGPPRARSRTCSARWARRETTPFFALEFATARVTLRHARPARRSRTW